MKCKPTVIAKAKSLMLTNLAPSPELCRNCILSSVCSPLPSIEVFAFTGLSLGKLAITAEDDKTVTLLTKSGKDLIFDKVTGVQTNANKPRFANHIAPATQPTLVAPEGGDK